MAEDNAMAAVAVVSTVAVHTNDHIHRRHRPHVSNHRRRQHHVLTRQRRDSAMHDPPMEAHHTRMERRQLDTHDSRLKQQIMMILANFFLDLLKFFLDLIEKKKQTNSSCRVEHDHLS